MNAMDWATLDRAGFAAAKVLAGVLWQSTILFALVATAALVLRRGRASLRHALWAGAVIAAPLLPLVAVLFSRIDAPRAEVAVLPRYAEPATPAPVVEMPAPSPATPTEMAPIDPAVLAAAAATVKPAPPAPRPGASDCPWAVLLGVYAAGVGIGIAWLLAGHVRIGLWRRGARPSCDAGLREAFERARVALCLRHAPVVLESARVPAPFSAGLVRGAVVLPTGFARDLSERERLAMAIHESAHVARREPLVLTLVALARAVLFFHPLVWLAARRVAAAAEEAADDRVLEASITPVSYARMLARVAERLADAPLSLSAAGIVLSKSAILTRIEAILSEHRAELRRASRRLLLATVAAALVSLAVTLALPLGERSTQPDSGAGNSESAAVEADGDAERPEIPAAPPATASATAIFGARFTTTGRPQFLYPLTHRLMAAREKERSGPEWTAAGTGAVRLTLEVAPDVAAAAVTPDREIVVGFFDDATWATPRAWRSVSGAGTHVLGGIAPGRYAIGALLGGPKERPNGALGVNDEWPGTVDIRAGEMADVHIALSRAAMYAGWQSTDTVTVAPEKLSQDTVTLRTVDAKGRPVPYCDVTVGTGDRGIKAITDGEGAATFKSWTGEVTIQAWRRVFKPEDLSLRIVYSVSHAVLEEGRAFDLVIPEVPTGQSEISGTARDKDGQPLIGYVVNAIVYRERWQDPVAWASLVVAQASLSADGSYSVRGLPAGDYTVSITPFDNDAYVAEGGELRDETVLDEGQKAKIDFQVVRRESYHGKVILDDAVPPLPVAAVGHFASAASPGRAEERWYADSSGLFHVYLTAGQLRDIEDNQQGMLRFESPGDESIQGEVAIGGLSRDPSRPSLVTLARVPTGRPADELFAAAAGGNMGRVRDMLGASRDLANARDAKGRTPLFYAAAGGHLETCLALIAGGANVKPVDDEQQMPLHLAAAGGHAELTATLVAKGTPPNATDRAGRTALHLAAQNGHGDTAKALLAAGAFAEPRDNRGETPLHYAARANHPGMVAQLILAGEHVDARDLAGETPLHAAAAAGSRLAAVELVNHGADKSARDEEERTPFDVARDAAHSELAALLALAGAPAREK